MQHSRQSAVGNSDGVELAVEERVRILLPVGRLDDVALAPWAARAGGADQSGTRRFNATTAAAPRAVSGVAGVRTRPRSISGLTKWPLRSRETR